MGGELGRDLAAIGLGAQEAFVDTALQRMFRRQEIEGQAQRQVSSVLANQGMLHLLPTDIQKSFEKRNKDIFQAQLFLSQNRAQQLAPLRQLQQDVRGLITAPVELQGPPQITPGAPLQAPMAEQRGLPGVDRPVPTRQPEVIPMDRLQTVPQSRVELATAMPPQLEPPPDPGMTSGFTPQPTGPEVLTREPRSIERIRRLQGMDPLLVALATGDPTYGNLSISARAQTQRQQELLFRQKKFAFERQQSMLSNLQTLVGPDGRLKRVLPIFQPDGSMDLLEIGEATETGTLRTAQKLAGLLAEFASGPAIPEDRLEKLKDEIRLTNKAFQRQMQKGGVTVNNETPFLEYDPETGRFSMGPASKVEDAALARRAAAVRGSTKELADARGGNLTGKLLVGQIGRLRDTFQEQFFGISGALTRFSESLIAGMEGGQQFLSAVQSFQGGGPLAFNTTRFIKENPDGTLDEEGSARFRSQMRRRLTGRIGAFDRLLDLVVINSLKVRDPSVVREGEYARELTRLTEGGAAGFLASLDELELDIRERMAINSQLLNSAEEMSVYLKLLKAGVPVENARRVLVTPDPAREPFGRGVDPTEAAQELRDRIRSRREAVEGTEAQQRQAAINAITAEVLQQEGVDLTQDPELRRRITDAIGQFSESEAGQAANSQQLRSFIQRVVTDPVLRAAPRAPEDQPTIQAPREADPLAGAPPEVRAELERLNRRAQQLLGTGIPLSIGQVPQENRPEVVETLIRSEVLRAGMRMQDIGAAELAQVVLQVSRDIGHNSELTEQDIRRIIRDELRPVQERMRTAPGE